MKKVYKYPVIRVVNINTSGLMAQSVVGLTDEEPDYEYKGGGDVKEEKNSLGNLWDDLW